MSEQNNPDLADMMLETAQAAELLGVPARTLVRMADKGKIACTRTKGKGRGEGHRRFRLRDVTALKEQGAPEIDRANTTLTDAELAATVSTAEAQEMLDVSYHVLRRWEEEGTIVAHRPTVRNKVRYDRATIEAIAAARKEGSE